ncbi:MAG: glycosyltransferase family 2 protein [Solirubrobacterales bacterium]
MKICFVTANGQNAFFDELVGALRAELALIGVESTVAVGRFPAVDGETVYALVPPHEYFALTEPQNHPGKQHLARTVFICAEQPDSKFWKRNAELISQHGCPAFDINSHSARLLSAATGRNVEHFQLGWTESWAKHDPTTESVDDFVGRPIDVLHLGSRSPKRELALSQGASWLHKRDCRLVIGDDTAPLTEENPEWVGADAKWNMLGRSKILLNIHRDTVQYFEWLRVVQSICNGCVVLTETSTDTAPLVVGEHFRAGPASKLGMAADLLLDNPSKLHQVAIDAWSMLRTQLPLSESVMRLSEGAEGLLKKRSRPLAEVKGVDVEQPLVTQRFDDAVQLVKTAGEDPIAGLEDLVGRALRDQKLSIHSLDNDLRRLNHLVRSGEELPIVERVFQSAGHHGAKPLVTVITPLHNYEQHIGAALASASESVLREIELVVVDDGSSDGSQAAAHSWMVENPRVPALLLAHPTNRGLGQARNTAIDAARGEFVFALDADNSVYPRGIEKLVAALRGDPESSFAWGYLECHDPLFEPVGILSSHAWEPRRFGNGNYIDAMVLWRRSELLRLGGYTTDSQLYGWEDYELFVRLADEGGHGTLVPEFVARYRVSDISMAQTTNMAGVAMLRRLLTLYPETMHAARELATA